jgi:hypothetical protein
LQVAGSSRSYLARLVSSNLRLVFKVLSQGYLNFYRGFLTNQNRAVKRPSPSVHARCSTVRYSNRHYTV